MSENKSITLWGVIFTDDDEMTTRHTAHLTMDDAFAAGSRFARAYWAQHPAGLPFPDVDDDVDAMDVLRDRFDVRFEVEEVEIGHDVIRALAAQL